MKLMLGECKNLTLCENIVTVKSALDSTSKKITFLNQAAELLGLKNINGIAGRAEDAAIRKELGQFTVVVSRAVARLNVLCELCIPYLQMNGQEQGSRSYGMVTDLCVAYYKSIK